MLLDKIIHIFLPNRCVCCNQVISAQSSICDDCANGLDKVSGKLCNICGAPEGSCDCKRHPKWFDRCVSPFYYNGSAKLAVLNIKHHKIKQTADFLSKYMAQSVLGEYCGMTFDCIAFVPMFKSKQKRKGYNHSRLLADALSQYLGLPVIDVLKQTVSAKPQHLLPAKEREQNVSGIYSVVGDVFNKNILLVDDIITTCSTLSECARVLRLEGAAGVYCVTAATRGKSKEK